MPKQLNSPNQNQRYVLTKILQLKPFKLENQWMKMGHMPNVKILENQESEGYLHNLSDHQVFKHDIILIMVAHKQFVKKYLI